MSPAEGPLPSFPWTLLLHSSFLLTYCFSSTSADASPILLVMSFRHSSSNPGRAFIINAKLFLKIFGRWSFLMWIWSLVSSRHWMFPDCFQVPCVWFYCVPVLLWSLADVIVHYSAFFLILCRDYYFSLGLPAWNNATLFYYCQTQWDVFGSSEPGEGLAAHIWQMFQMQSSLTHQGMRGI